MSGQASNQSDQLIECKSQIDGSVPVRSSDPVLDQIRFDRIRFDRIRFNPAAGAAVGAGSRKQQEASKQSAKRLRL